MAVVNAVSRYEIWLVSLDPAKGSGIQKTRPCLIVSPDEMNKWLHTVIVAPMTSVTRACPSCTKIRFEGKTGQIALDQIRTIDKSRLIKRLGKAQKSTGQAVSNILIEMFAA